MEKTEELILNESVDVSEYELELFQDPDSHKLPANVTTYYLLEEEKQIRVVNQLINSSEIEIFPTENFGNGGRAPEKPLENLVLLVGPANQTPVDLKTFKELSNLTEDSDINYTLLKKTKQNQKSLWLIFDEPVTGYLAYSMQLPDSHNFVMPAPASKFVRVVLPENYATGNRFFGIPKPNPSSLSSDSKGRQVLFWRELQEAELLNVKYYKESAPKLLFTALLALLCGMLLVLLRYSKSKKELLKARGIFKLEEEYLKDQEKRKK
ncbi:MAG: DUF5803 family protein [Methanosarcinaceae archaeon]|nr:DUF5803 family protein [Methanosarcinaceae archaeon]MDD4331429.1 DUF5803 family protein [Methanosarcinaceae archaeon]MDD4748826.1 DUF5803 family protein [Methanosarcinaceae archaeon]